MVTTAAATPDWSRRFQELTGQATERSMASMANVQRLMTALTQAQLSPQALAAALPRFGEERGPEVYERLSRLVSAFVAAVGEVAGRCSESYLSDLVPNDARRNLGPRPSAPPPPEHASAGEWATWSALFSARAADQQAWLARLYGLMLDEVAEGRLARDEVQVSTDEFLRDQAPAYLTQISELGADFLAAALEIADDAVDELSDWLLGHDAGDRSEPDEVVVEGAGTPGGSFRRSLLVESTLDRPASVTCAATPAPGFGLDVVPAGFELAPADARAVTITVTLPAAPAGNAGEVVEAGTVVVRGQGERELVVRIDALVEPPAEG